MFKVGAKVRLTKRLHSIDKGSEGVITEEHPQSGATGDVGVCFRMPQGGMRKPFLIHTKNLERVV
jgi:hypothetical protein